VATPSGPSGPSGPSAGSAGSDTAVAPFVAGAQRSVNELLDVEVLEAGPERVVLRLPVNWKVHQPFGILHGGVSALLAESAASLGGAIAAGPERGVVGIELNASHLPDGVPTGAVRSPDAE
jgi:uncharacterized protein (TIGR00369 family)